MSFFHGLAIGLGTAFFTGPVFFTLLKNTLQYGRHAGLAVALGILLSDLLVLILCLAFANAFLQDILDHQYSSKASSLLLLFFGVLFILTNPKTSDDKVATTKGNLISAFIQGFLVNFVNPFVFVLWLGFIALSESYEGNLQYLFFAGILCGVFSTDLIKTLLAHKIKAHLKDKWIGIVYTVLGIALILFAIRMWFI